MSKNNRKVTINDIAECCNVSKTAVSLVMNKKQTGIGISAPKAELILKTAMKMNYQPLQAAVELSRRRKRKLKVLLVSPWLDVSNSYFMSEVYTAMQEFSEKIIFESKLFKFGKLEQTLASKEIEIYDAIFVMGTVSKEHVLLKQLADRGIKIVLINRHVFGCSCYLTDNVASGELLASRALASDYYDNYYLWKTYGASQAIKDREHGLKNVFKQSGKKLELLKVTKDDLYGYLSSKVDMFSKGKSLIFFNYDDLALQSMLFFLKKGFSIPEKIGIVGHDNIPAVRNLEPRITTADARICEAVKCAFQDLLDNNLSRKTKFFKPEVISGSSSL